MAIFSVFVDHVRFSSCMADSLVNFKIKWKFTVNKKNSILLQRGY